jgi:UPF0755 protein
MGRAGRVICLIAAAAALAAGGVVMWGFSAFVTPGALTTDTRVLIVRGAGLRDIAATLAEAGVIRHRLLFIAMTRWHGDQDHLQAGEYNFVPRITPAAVLATIRAGRVVIRKLTIPEGLTSTQIRDILAKAEGLSGSPLTAPEGSLLPETYDYAWGDTRAGLIRRMAAAQRTTLEALWRERQTGLPLTGPREAVILASIVEKETGAASERARVAAVFHNRLRRGMRLQSDPTIIYALTGGKTRLGRNLNRADLAIDHPYNTYRIKGLPPGPIANPGRAALIAVLNPVKSTELYFVADGSGGHAFAKTLKEHNRNVAKWRRLLRRTGKRPPKIPN